MIQRVPDVLMFVGIAAAVAGVYVLLGLGWFLLIGGVVLAVVGYFLELGWFSHER